MNRLALLENNPCVLALSAHAAHYARIFVGLLGRARDVASKRAQFVGVAFKAHFVGLLNDPDHFSAAGFGVLSAFSSLSRRA